MKTRLVFDADEWITAGGDVGDNSLFWHPAEILTVRRSEYRGERLADVKFTHSGKVSKGHFLGMMRKI